MTGSRDGAIAAWMGDLPELDEGSTRRVFRDGNVVYKVETYRGANRDEINNMTDLADSLPEGFVFPAWSEYIVDTRTIIAMDYIEGVVTGFCLCDLVDMDCYCETVIEDSYYEAFAALGLTDLGYGNVIWREGINYIIDADLLTTPRPSDRIIT